MSNLSESERDALSKYLFDTVKKLPDENWDTFITRRRQAAAAWSAEQQRPKPVLQTPPSEAKPAQQATIPKRRGRRKPKQK